MALREMKNPVSLGLNSGCQNELRCKILKTPLFCPGKAMILY